MERRAWFERCFAFVGMLCLCVASVCVGAAPLFAAAGALAGLVFGLCIRRQGGEGSSDGLQFSRVVLISGGGIVAMTMFFSSRAGFTLLESTLPFFQHAFYSFGAFALSYAIVCFVIFLFILASQPDRTPPK